MGCGISKQALGAPDKLMATYQILPSFQYSRYHHLYVHDVDAVGNDAPPPRAPPTRKADIFKLWKYGLIDKRAASAPKKLLYEPIFNLVSYLIHGMEDELAKARSLYVWLASLSLENVDVPSVQPNTTLPMYLLWRIKTKKGNYAQMFSVLCRLAKVPCVIIHGKLKGFSYDIGQQIDSEQHYGEWNAVLIENYWRFIDAYWGSCAVGIDTRQYGRSVDADDSSKRYTFDENYFLTDPEQMLSTHFPDEPIWQLMKDPISQWKFETQAFVRDRYFNFNMKILSHPDCVIYVYNGEVDIRLGVPEELSHKINYNYMFSLLNGRQLARRFNNYVCLQRMESDMISIRLRSPISGVFRFELVAKDTTSAASTYDWVVIYKIVFERGHTNCRPFPVCPKLCWGPNKETLDIGLISVSHRSGEIFTSDGNVEIVFMVSDQSRVSKYRIFPALSTGSTFDEKKLKDMIIYRNEKGRLLIFNIKLPTPGEYSFTLNITSAQKSGPLINMCSYLITSAQNIQSQLPYPRGFDRGIGAKRACAEMGLIPVTHHSGLIETDVKELKIAFQMLKPLDVQASLVGMQLKTTHSKRLIQEEIDKKVISFTMTLPKKGTYGTRIVAKHKTVSSCSYETVYEYIIEYRERKRAREVNIRTSLDELREIPNSEVGDDSVFTGQNSEISVSPISRSVVDFNESVTTEDKAADVTVKTDSGIDVETESLSPPNEMEENQSPPPSLPGEVLPAHRPISISSHHAEAERMKNEEMVEKAAKFRLRHAIQQQNAGEIKAAMEDMQCLDMAYCDVTEDIKMGVDELKFLKMKADLEDALEARCLHTLNEIMAELEGTEYASRLQKEMKLARDNIERLVFIQNLRHEILEMDTKTIQEIKGYAAPPTIVHTVMSAALLLLGFFSEDTEDWNKIQSLIGKQGRISVLRRFERFDINNLSLDVCMGAKEILCKYTLEQVRGVSAGAATFFVWTQGIIKEVEMRYGEALLAVRPRTSLAIKKRMKPAFHRDYTL